MASGLPRTALHRSVFGKLLAIMLAMAFSIIGLVAAFFVHIVNPMVGSAVDRMLGDYGRRIAADAPDQEEALRLAGRLHVQIRYEGPNGGWTTDESLPTITQVLAKANKTSWFSPAWGHTGYLVEAPGGGRYLFVWEFGQRAHAAHDRLLVLLLALMIAVFASAHLVLSRALRPLRTLQDGVTRLSAGDLDVVLENRTHDEFGSLTEAFNRMAARVKEMLGARDQLLLDVSHELRSPLTRLKVALALLPPSPKRTQAEADVAEMDALTTELLELERLRDGRGLRTGREDLVVLLHEAAQTHADGPPGVEVSACTPALPLDLDGAGVRTVLRNLLENAVKNSRPDSRPVELSVAREAGSLVVRVVDDGPGIPEQDLARVFEPFFRVDRSRSRKTGGYGLGLSICKRIVEAHGGQIEAGNTPGRGACFTLRFSSGSPARRAPKAAGSSNSNEVT